MKNAIGTISFYITALSLLGMLTGFLMLFHKDSKKQGLKILTVSVIVFVIGFGTCTALFKWH
jgi:hypothetical protein